MSKLVETLKLEHASIVNMLGRVSELGIATEAGQKALLNVRDALLSHIQREEAELHSKLQEIARVDPVVEDVLEFFHEDISRVSNLAQVFFEEFIDVRENASFDDEIRLFAGQLTQSFRKEESVIYRQFDQFYGENFRTAENLVH